MSTEGGLGGLPRRERNDGTAADALAALAVAHERWSSVLASLDDVALRAPIGPVGGQYAEASRLGFVLHMLDEFIHHAAEVATLRDLFTTMRLER